MLSLDIVMGCFSGGWYNESICYHATPIMKEDNSCQRNSNVFLKRH